MRKILGRRRRADSGTYVGQPSVQEQPLPVGITSRRITSAANWGSWFPQYTCTSMKPQAFSIPRIRILLAPYMSPFVVPLHKVETWALLNETIIALFGPEISKESTIRITDHLGNSILPAVWQDLVEPNMTIIVDNGALLSEGDDAASVIFSKEEEDSYGGGVSQGIGQALPMMPQGRPPARGVGGDGDTAMAAPVLRVSRNWGLRGLGEGMAHPLELAATRYSGRPPPPTQALPAPPASVDEKPVRKQTTGGKGTEKEWKKEREREQRESRHLPPWSKHMPPTPKPKQKSKHAKSSFSRFAKALMSIFSPRPTLQNPQTRYSRTEPAPKLVVNPNRKSKQGHKQTSKLSRHFPEPQGKILASAIENNPPRQIRAERRHPPEPQREILASAIENNPPMHIHADTLSARRGTPPLPSIIPATTPSPPPSTTQSAKRSKSLSQLKDAATALATPASPSVSASVHIDKPLPKLPFKFSAFPPPARPPQVAEGCQKNVCTEGKIPPMGV